MGATGELAELTSRQAMIIRSLLDLRAPISAADLSVRLGIPLRTLKAELDNLKEASRALGCELVSRPKVGTFLKVSEAVRATLLECLWDRIEVINWDAEARRLGILWRILVQGVFPTVSEVEEVCMVSRPTASGDLTAAARVLSSYSAGWKRIGRQRVLVGEEHLLTLAFGDIFYDWLKVEIAAALWGSRMLALAKKTRAIAQEQLRQMAKVGGNGFNLKDEIRAERELQYAALRGRLQEMQGSFVLDRQNENVESPNRYTSSSDSIRVTPLGDETSIRAVSSSNGNKTFVSYSEFVFDFVENKLGLPVARDEQLWRMLNLHLSAAIDRATAHLPVQDPGLRRIREENPFAYALASRVRAVLERQLGVTLPQEETGHLTLYLAAALERSKHSAERRKKVAVVCPSGYATSYLLSWRLRNEFPDLDVVYTGSLAEADGTIISNADLIVSTVPLEGYAEKCVVVSMPTIREAERRLLMKLIKQSTSTNKDIGKRIILRPIDAETTQGVLAEMFELAAQMRFINPLATPQSRGVEAYAVKIGLPLALCHADRRLIRSEAIIVGVTRKQVEFPSLEVPEHRISTKIVIYPLVLGLGPVATALYRLLDASAKRKVSDSKLDFGDLSGIEQFLRDSVLEQA
ncbi:PRD domain-containing protein [Coprothermobacteraceae bacterium]|nr:PRD domain-containing protein [Coprothermobacteraceae bacterium]